MKSFAAILLISLPLALAASSEAQAINYVTNAYDVRVQQVAAGALDDDAAASRNRA